MKAEVVRYGLERNFDFALTYSCAKGEPIHCGECGSCLSRIKAFAANNFRDPTVYLLKSNG
jgi:7-cyano-7-deazaguanine synthase